MELDHITGAVLDASIGIHRALGPGLLESVYALVLAAALERRGLRVQRELPVNFSYDGMHFKQAFRIDLLIEGSIIVEVKSLEKCGAVHAKQLLTYRPSSVSSRFPPRLCVNPQRRWRFPRAALMFA